VKKLILQTADLALETRRKEAIQNRMTREAPIDGDYAEQAAREKEFPLAKRRFVGPCRTYNCHGLTFAARRSEVHWDQVVTILEHDDYVAVPRNKVRPGDVIIYFGETLTGLKAAPEHSGVVIEVLPLNAVKVLSKWGYGDEWIHTEADCPYSKKYVEFFRVSDCPRARAA
jgi:hypothetical protein